MKKTIKLSESKLNSIIEETIKSALRESSENAWADVKQHLEEFVVDMYELSDHTGGIGLTACDYVEKAIDELSKIC